MAIYRIPVRIEGTTTPGGPWMNILHVSTQPGGQPGDLGEALDALEAFYTALRNYFSTAVQVIIGEGMIEDPGGSPQYVDDDRRVVVGAAASPANLSALLAVVVSWRTASATRSGRGRTFLGPFVTLANENNGTPAPDLLSRINVAAQALVEDSQSANGWAFGVLSTTQGTFRPVTGHSVRDRFAVLRSRRD